MEAVGIVVATTKKTADTTVVAAAVVVDGPIRTVTWEQAREGLALCRDDDRVAPKNDGSDEWIVAGGQASSRAIAT